MRESPANLTPFGSDGGQGRTYLVRIKVWQFNPPVVFAKPNHGFLDCQHIPAFFFAPNPANTMRTPSCKTANLDRIAAS